MTSFESFSTKMYLVSSFSSHVARLPFSLNFYICQLYCKISKVTSLHLGTELFIRKLVTSESHGKLKIIWCNRRPKTSKTFPCQVEGHPLQTVSNTFAKLVAAFLKASVCMLFVCQWLKSYIYSNLFLQLLIRNSPVILNNPRRNFPILARTNPLPGR